MFRRGTDDTLVYGFPFRLRLLPEPVTGNRGFTRGALCINTGGLGSAWANNGSRRDALLFGLLCLFVAVVSVHDAALVVVNHEVIHEVEQNPVGRWLLEVQGGEVWLFVFVKLVSTSFVCAVLIACYQTCQRLAMCIARGLATFQLTLLGYLTAF